MSNIEVAAYIIKAIWLAAGMTAYLTRGEIDKARRYEEDYKAIYKEIERMATNDAHETQRDAQSADASDIR